LEVQLVGVPGPAEGLGREPAQDGAVERRLGDLVLRDRVGPERQLERGAPTPLADDVRGEPVPQLARLGDGVPDRVDRVRESALEAQTHTLALAHEPAERCVLVAHGRLLAAISPSVPRSQRYARQLAGGASVARVMMVP